MENIIVNFVNKNEMLKNEAKDITRGMYILIENKDTFVIEMCNNFAFVFEFSFGHLTGCRIEEGTDIIEKYLYLIPKSRNSEFINFHS